MIKRKLTPFGYIIIILGIAIAVIAVTFVADMIKGSKERIALENTVLDEIARFIKVSENIGSGLGNSEVQDRIAVYKEKINTAKEIPEKIELCHELTNYLVKYTVDNPSFTDELNGARNRILVARKKLRR